MAAQQLEDIGAIEEVDVGGYELVSVKHEPTTVGTVSRRHPTAGIRSRCPYGCNKMIALRTIDYHRTNGCRPGQSKEESFGDTSKKRYYCCGVCFMEFVTRTSFHEHLSVEHDVHPEINELVFDNMVEFKRFVRWLELKGGAHFRHKSGSKRRQRGRGIFMACNRSGFVNSSNATGSDRDRVGPYRMGHTCTAYIHGTQHADGRVSIEMCGDHYGHDVRMRLPPIIKSIIAQRQMEGESNADIIDYLRQHFLPFAADNIYAQRACLVDNEELRTINITATKKWEVEGIPTTCEIWEEELLDLVGIVREGVPRVRELHEKTTEEIAIEQNWPKPQVFTAKVRMKNGEFVPAEAVSDAERGVRDDQYHEDSACASPENVEGYESTEASFQNNGPPAKKPMLSEVLRHREDSPEEYIDVDGVADVAHLPSSSSSARVPLYPVRRNFVPKGAPLSKEQVLQELFQEIGSLKYQIIESAKTASAISLHYLLLRLRALRPVAGQSPSSHGAPLEFREGRLTENLCHYEAEAADAGSYDVMSDDEDIVLSSGATFEFNNYIWR
ncbi:hypothetical protein Y032_0045g1252 [Ancylostoma ceylanicum]|uniref:C2H2-type domain-containing protein n=1 Tax=Ancylostoma ceylanicum TaxID=53326 RepID=A0A016UDV3_9BILA|nr:hypothetical protein Y032_0045g1252 [Ancylostoma ceylanicum]